MAAQMEPFIIEMPGPDRLWTVRFEEGPPGSFSAVATSGTETRRSRWRLSDDLTQTLEEYAAAEIPDLTFEPRSRFLFRAIVRLYRERLQEVVAIDGYQHVITTVEELTGPRVGDYLNLIEREISDSLFELVEIASLLDDHGNLPYDPTQPHEWLVAEPGLRDSDDPAIQALFPSLDAFYLAYEELVARDFEWHLRRRVNALGCRALSRLAALRAPAPPGAPTLDIHIADSGEPQRAWWLRELTIERFKAALGPATLPLMPLTVLIGRNAGGKSTPLQALQWVATALRQDIVKASDPYYGLHDLIHRLDPGSPRSFRLQLGWTEQDAEPARDLRYAVRVEDASNGARSAGKPPRITGETLTLRTGDGDPDGDGRDLLDPVPGGRSPELLALRYTRGQSPHHDIVREFWDRAVFLRLSPSRLAQASPAARKSFEPMLDEEGQNLPALLNELGDDERADLIETLDDVLSIHIDGLDLSSAGPGDALSYSLRERLAAGNDDADSADPVAIPSWMLSEGTRRLTAIFALLCHDPPPSLLCIEEIENGLDPWTARAVFRHLQAAVDRGTQVVVTTHSPWVLDIVPMDSIVQVRRVDGDVRYERFADRPEIQRYDPSIPPGTRYVNEIE